MITGTAGGAVGHSLYFNQVASAEPDAAQQVEYKQCEGLCGGFFYRPRAASAREGEKFCPRCKAVLAEQALTVSKGKYALPGGGRGKCFRAA